MFRSASNCFQMELVHKNIALGGLPFSLQDWTTQQKEYNLEKKKEISFH